LQLTVSEVSGCGCLAQLLWAVAATVHHGRSVWWRRPLTFWQVGSKERDGKGPGSQHLL
jgi:hypothetical protein